MIHRVVKQVWSDLLKPLWREKKPLNPSVIIAPVPSSADSQPSSSIGSSSVVTSELFFDFSLGNAVNTEDTHVGGNEELSSVSQVNYISNSACDYRVLIFLIGL